MFHVKHFYFMQSTMNRRAEVGLLGETTASNHLIHRNYRIIHRNFHIGRIGEIDIIAEKSKGIWPFNKNLESMTLEEDLKDTLISAFVKQFTGLQDPSVLVEIGTYFGKTARVWVSSSTGTLAARFGCGSIGLDLNGSGILYNSYAARGVRRGVGAEGDAPKNEGTKIIKK